MFCSKCSASHHLECWEENGGCAVVGCAEISTASKGIPPVDLKPRAEIKVNEGGGSQSPVPSRESAKTGLSDSILVASFAGLMALALIGVFLLSVTFGGGSSPDEAENVASGQLPGIPPARMALDIQRDVERWYDYIDKGQFEYAWEFLSERKREQITSSASGEYPDGRYSWQVSMSRLKRKLNFRDSKIRIDLLNPSYPDEGVKSIRLMGLVYSSCGRTLSGVTWVSYDDANDRWLYEPGVDLTVERSEDWGDRFDLVTHQAACY
jgi:hypothetical protein